MIPLKKKVIYQGREYIIEFLSNGNIKINDTEYLPSIKQSAGNIYKVSINDQQFTVEVKDDDVVIDGEKVDLEIKPYISLPQGVKKRKQGGTVKITAPIPGTILQILVSEGDEVSKDQELFILEAMKMRNRITAPREGKIKEIKIKEGETVSSDQVLALLE